MKTFSLIALKREHYSRKESILMFRYFDLYVYSVKMRCICMVSFYLMNIY
jgi:hypothetical protein